MEEKITKVRNGLWEVEHGDGVVSQHSTKAGAEAAYHVTYS
jgi:hypothetical protein